VDKKETGSKHSKQLERIKQQAEAKGDKAAEEVKLKAKKAPSQQPSHENKHEFD
jgi:hypothetical protein